jgi:hypothetical protein
MSTRKKREWGTIITTADYLTPGLRSILTRYAAYVGDQLPSPTVEQLKPLLSYLGESPRSFPNMLSAALYTGCNKCSYVSNNNGSSLDLRNALITGMILPLIVASRSGSLYSCIFADGTTWSVNDGTPFCDTDKERGNPVNWVRDKSPAGQQMVLVSKVLSFCVEPEYSHWHNPVMEIMQER